MPDSFVHRPPLPDEQEIGLPPALAPAEIFSRALPRGMPFPGDHFYRQLLQSLPAAVYICDAQGRIQLYNDAAVQLWGREPRLGVDLWCGSFRIYCPDGVTELPPAGCPMAVALSEGRSVRGAQIIVERPDGTRRNVLPFPTPLRDADGNITGAVNMLVDITDRRCEQDELARLRARLEGESARSQQAVRESEQRFRALADHAQVGIALTDLRGNCLFVNRSWCAMTGASAEQSAGKSWTAALHADDRERVTGEWEAAARKNVPFAGEFRFLRPDGTVTWLQGGTVPWRDADGNIAGHIATVVDITARKSAESALTEAKEAAEAANRSKDRFLALLSHELRTPLTPVLMTVTAHELNPNVPADLRDDFAMIRRNVELETKLIDDLLDLNRITSGKLRLRPQAIDLNDTVRHVCEICNAQVLEKGIRLQCDLAEDVGSVTADPARLQQVLWNVLKNAAKFTPEGGQIQVRTERSPATDPRVRVVVKDNGGGIAPDVLPRIFDAFEQGDAKVTHRFGGLGLGLAISKALIELHDGTIRAHSDGPGRGSTFTIELPAPLGVRADDRSTRRGGDCGGAKRPRVRLLVVEDHVDTADLLRRLLGASGYDVKTAHTAGSAMDLVRRERFDLLISDIGLPDATGYQLMREIGAARDAMKGIAMSGFGMDEDIRKSRDAGFSDHLVKPINMAQLEEAIRRLLHVVG